MPLAADRQEADDEAQRRGRERAEKNGELGRQAPDLGGMRGDIGGGAEEGRVAEGQQADEADEEIEGAGEQGKAQHVHQVDRIMHERRDERGRDSRGDEQQIEPRAKLARSRALSRHDAHAALPKSPAGRNKSTMAMTTKITIFEASG